MGNTLEEAAYWALGFFANQDKSNAAIHCAPVRFSPITFRLAEALVASYEGWIDNALVIEVLGDVGKYREDPGR